MKALITGTFFVIVLLVATSFAANDILEDVEQVQTNIVDEWSGVVSDTHDSQLTSRRRCENSLHCKGSCIDGFCTGESRGGDRCTTSLHCADGSCIDGRCTASSGGGGGRRCTSSLHCEGSCIDGYCTNSGSRGDRCTSSLHCKDGSCLSGRCT